MVSLVFLLIMVGSVVGLPHRYISSEAGPPTAVPDPGNGTLNPEEEDDKIYQGIRSRYRYPFYVTIMANTGNGVWQLVCGGSLIDRTSVLSAGHCTTEFSTEYQWEAWLNPYQLSREPLQRIPIASATTSNDYNNQTYYNDIGMYTLSQPATIDDKVSVICIGSYENYNNIKVELVGFGKTGCRNTSPISDILLYAKGTTVSAERCMSTRDDIKNKANQVCAKLGTPKYAEQGSGDSGGPLFGQADGKFTQIGLVSYNLAFQGSGCPAPDYPGVYTLAAKHMAFISDHAPEAGLC